MCNIEMEKAIDALFAPFYRALEALSSDTKNVNSVKPSKDLFFMYGHRW